ncbi:hypothetical protein VXL34_02265 [Phaeobacter sp. JH20_13]|uniref:hypothetical protein n=1 Tax=Phaeobacter sp. JH20_13 TaxID=3112472 RepID=UPI003A8912EA
MASTQNDWFTTKGMFGSFRVRSAKRPKDRIGRISLKLWRPGAKGGKIARKLLNLMQKFVWGCWPSDSVAFPLRQICNLIENGLEWARNGLETWSSETARAAIGVWNGEKIADYRTMAYVLRTYDGLDQRFEKSVIFQFLEVMLLLVL